MTILLTDRSVGDRGFWQTTIDHENEWLVIWLPTIDHENGLSVIWRLFHIQYTRLVEQHTADTVQIVALSKHMEIVRRIKGVV